ncbi:recombinase family protein, partial [Eubacteriales bacterium OttesenSCG-928-A19]|nr:recombinase family protein [Eubacteriales bacterium OttesenSCG-928-A19]
MGTEKTFGYARVSTREQNEARQVEALREAGVGERDIFVDKQSGKDFDRPMYQAMLAQLRAGDTVIIQSIDRLGRDYTAITAEWKRITEDLGVDLQVLDMPMLNTRRPDDSLDGRFISNLVLQILSYVAEKERAHLRERQRQGIAIARARGKHLGRPRLAVPEGFDQTVAAWQRGEMTAVAAMRKLG